MTTDKSCATCRWGPDCGLGLERYPPAKSRYYVCDPGDFDIPVSELDDKWEPKLPDPPFGIGYWITPAPAVIYTRFSPRKDADESLSCEKQKEICVEYCRKMKYNVDLATRYFEDKAMSGDDGDRPGL